MKYWIKYWNQELDPNLTIRDPWTIRGQPENQAQINIEIIPYFWVCLDRLHCVEASLQTGLAFILHARSHNHSDATDLQHAAVGFKEPH